MKQSISLYFGLSCLVSACVGTSPSQEERQVIRANMERLRAEQLQREQLKYYRKQPSPPEERQD